jgi:hypothetical protein
LAIEGGLKQRAAALLAVPLQHAETMAPDLENAAIEGIPKIVELMMTIPEEKRSLALAAAYRSYLHTAQALGYGATDAQQWASMIMSLVQIAAADGVTPIQKWTS